MNPFDEETGPASFTELLNPTQAQAQAPQMPDGAGMAAVLGAGDPAQPSMFERGRAWASENPMGAQMLLHTFMRMAQGGGKNLADTVGQGVASGAQAGLFHMAQSKQDKEKSEKQKREDAQKQQEFDLNNRRVNIAEEDLNLRQANAPIDRSFKQAQTKKLENETQQSQNQAPLVIEQMKAKIAATQQEILNSRDAITTNKLRRQLLGLQAAAQAFENDLNKVYAPSERGAKVEGQELQNESRRQANTADQRLNSDMDTLTPQQRLTMGKGGRQGKTEQEMYADFLARNMDLFDGDGTKARQAWEAANMTPEKQAAQEQATRAAFEKARSSVKVGELYKGPDGKTYRRKN